MSLLIGLGRTARVGKDSLAQHWVERFYSLGVLRMSFAGPLKMEVNEAFRAFVLEQFSVDVYELKSVADFRQYWEAFARSLHEHEGFPEVPLTITWDDPHSPLGKVREILQWWGTEKRRAVDPNYWTDQAQKTVDAARACSPKVGVIVITDMRFGNEGDFLRANRGVYIELTNYNNVTDVVGIKGHASENGILYPDLSIGASSLEELFHKGDLALLQLLAGG